MKKVTILDPFVKTFAKWYLRKCSKCDTTYIEAVLNSFKEKNSCPECKKQIIFGKILLKTIMFCMKINNDDLSNLSSDEELIYSIKALFRGISKRGFMGIETGMPLYVVFDITNKCNLKCIHCYSAEQKGELTTKEAYHILDMLYKSGAAMVDFGGGEPLLRKDIFDIISYSKKLGFYTSISTNGTLLNKTCVTRLRSLDIDHICISLDGAKPETHDFIRQKKGTFLKTIDGIKNSINAGMNTQISTVFMKNNVDELCELYHLLESLKVNGWYIYDFIPAGHGKEIKNNVLDIEQREKLFKQLQELAIFSKMSLKPYPDLVTINSSLDKKSYFYKAYSQLTEFIKGCPTGRWTCHISSNGDLHPCHLLPFKLGNLKQENFEDVWFKNNNQVLKELRDKTLLKGNCGICKYRDVCGGCRARAFWETGNYLESDNCWINTARC